MRGDSVIKLLSWGSSPVDAEGDGGGTQEYTHRGSLEGGLLSYSNQEAVALRQGRAKQQVTFHLPVTFRKCQKVKIKDTTRVFFSVD